MKTKKSRRLLLALILISLMLIPIVSFAEIYLCRGAQSYSSDFRPTPQIDCYCDSQYQGQTFDCVFQLGYTGTCIGKYCRSTNCCRTITP